MNENINVHDNYPNSNEHLEVPTMKVIPLKKICMTIGELPTAYVETMTYYEMLLWFIAYLRDNIIPVVNGNGEAVEELQNVVMSLQNYINEFKDSIDEDVENLETYINNYFDNLDVQEEINNKLDQMLEDGVLEQIIEQFLQLTSLICFDNVADMKASTNLANGSYAKTLGYYSVNDGGEGLYKVRTITNDDIVDEGSIIALNDNTLIAELIYNDTLNVKCFGVKGDNINDEYTNINKALTFAKNNQLKLYFPTGEYICNDTLVIDVRHVEIYGDGKNKTIIYFNKQNSTFINLQASHTEIHDIQFYGGWTSGNQYCIKNVDENVISARNRFKNMKIRNFQNGIYITNYSDCNIISGVDFHLVANCIYLKQNDNGIIEDCTAEPFTNTFCELFQPNACAVRNCLVNTSSQSYDNIPSTAFIITGNHTGGDGQHYGSCVTIENIHAEYIHQFALIGISDVSIKDVYIYNNNKTSTKHMFHYANIGNNPINNCSLSNIWIDKTNFESGKYGIFKANYSESSITAPNGTTYNCSVNNFSNFKVNGFNSTVEIPKELVSGVYTDYEITNNKVTYKNDKIIISDNNPNVPTITANNVNNTYYTFGKSINDSTIFNARKFSFKYDSVNSSWTPFNIYSVNNLQGTTISYKPLTKDGTILLSIEGRNSARYANLLMVMRDGLLKVTTELNNNGLTIANNSDNDGITITSSDYQNPFYITENVINKNLF